MNKLSYSIPSPCSEDWNTMTPNEQGRHCDKCAMTVIDFTKMTEAEIILTLQSAAGQRICGRMRQEVKSENLSPVSVLSTQGYRLPKLSASIYTLSIATLLLASCQNSNSRGNTTVGEMVPVEETVLLGEPAPDTTNTDSLDAPACAKDSSNIHSKLKPKPKKEYIELTGDVAIEMPVEHPDSVFPPPEPPIWTGDNLDDTLNFAEKTPSFPGGEKEFHNFLKENLIYPEMEKQAGVEGTVYARFVVSPEGKILNIQILRSISGFPNFDQEVIRVIKAMPDWLPGEDDRGNKRYIRYTIPVRFRLD